MAESSLVRFCTMACAACCPTDWPAACSGELGTPVCASVSWLAKLRPKTAVSVSWAACPFKRPPPKTSGVPGDEGPARQRGKQHGAQGKNRRQVDNPDEKIDVEPGACTGCGAGLADAELLRIYRRQVFEASPPPPPRVIQYGVAERRCGCCGQVNQGQAPRFVTGRVQWGPSVSARAVLATIAHHLPCGRAAVLLAKLSGLSVSTGFLVKARRRATVLLDPFITRVRELLHRVGLLRVDETTARVDGGRTLVRYSA